MELALIGLAKSGKTTLFNALTSSRVEDVTWSPSREDTQVGVAHMPDSRLDTLAELFKPNKVVPAEITYWDIPPTLKESGNEGPIGGQHLNVLQRADTLVMVVRVFQDPSVPHPLGELDPHRDATTMMEELTYSDLGILERRSQRIQFSLKGALGHESDVLLREESLVQQVRQQLEAGLSVREQHFSSEEERTLSNFRLLTAKPLLVVMNIDEAALPQKAELDEELTQSYGQTSVRAVSVCAKLEMELSQLSPEEEREFRKSMGAKEGVIESILRLSFELLGLVSFFTYASQEVRAWTVPANTLAGQAAGQIHSDMERGFIRAEVVDFPSLIKLGSTAEAKRQGVLRLEGKGYPVQDGDVITFLFNV